MLLEQIEVKVGMRVIAKAREWSNVFIDGTISEIAKGPVYSENIKVIDENTTIFHVKADRWIGANFKGIINSTLTTDIVPYAQQYWDSLASVIKELNWCMEHLNSIFKNASREAPSFQKRETVLRRMLNQEGYSNLDEVVEAGTAKYLAFRKKLFAEYEKAETILKVAQK